MHSFISVPLLRSEEPAARMDATQGETAEWSLPELDLRTRTL